MSKFVNLDFRLTEYADDGDSVVKEIRFSGHDGYQDIRFIKEKPTWHELRLLKQLSECLEALAKPEPPAIVGVAATEIMNDAVHSVETTQVSDG